MSRATQKMLMVGAEMLMGHPYIADRPRLTVSQAMGIVEDVFGQMALADTNNVAIKKEAQ